MNILMVCLGNICRSPLAEGILKSKVDSQISIDSAGTGDWHVGEKPDPRSVAIAKTNGIDISIQRARQFTVSDFENFDLIYAMDNSNYENIIAQAKSQEDIDKVRLILNEIFPGEDLDVPDPYFGGKSGFKNVFEMLDQACDVIVEKLNANKL
jgi:protein-tyrosine phosphatase